MAKRKRSKQAQYQKQYAELLRNAKMIYQDLQLGLKLGEKTPSIERILKEAGTRSGLTKPSKKSIQALKKLQTESGILRQTYWSMSKGPEREKAKEMFEQAYEEEQTIKKMEKEERRIDKEIKELEEEAMKPVSKKKKEEIQKNIDQRKKEREEMFTAAQYRFLLEIRKQVQRAIEPYMKSKYLTSFEEKIVNPGIDIINFINSALASNDISKLKAYEENAKAVIAEYGTIEAEDLYKDGYKILEDLRIIKLAQAKEQLEINTDNTDTWDDFDPDFPIPV